MNKLNLLIIALTLLSPLSAISSDYVMNDYKSGEEHEQSVDSGDPCVVVLCMFGKVTGNSGGGECSSPEKTFFNIIKKKKGSFLPNPTSDARKAFISKCDTAGKDTIDKIIRKFGKIKL
ncbi:TrbM/KikA/MpfK family conjugal transfer protein [Erwinia tasmaniensis]|uniref:KikA protein n=1 Tax=Erwinia tasmaniensis (strain DSM 17950 / CFBP 7177 / CIP 109463 / NCPPB 4357 / Et1/99) TaxID=465817 RepID=B2VAV6_ERWT9|nr:TrbM/KikA/MpfK family conjugal transfer protein [Erwinia tasmaniensis]CAO94859.1 KikA protein [Erwinia tasmaniensis Et1/99]